MDTKKNITENNIGAEAVGALFNLTNDTVERFVLDYLDAKKVTGVSRVVAYADREGTSSPSLTMMVYFNSKSNCIDHTIENKIPQLARNKFENYNIQLTDSGKSILFPLCNGNIYIGKDRNEYILILNTFSVLGLMLDVDRYNEDIAVLEAKRVDNTTLFAVIKSKKLSSPMNNGGDNIIRRSENFRRRQYNNK